MTQQTEHDDALIEKKRLADWLTDVFEYAKSPEYIANRDALIALLRGNEPAKPDRYLQVWKEANEAYMGRNQTKHESDRAAAAVLRSHFEPSADVVEAARTVREIYTNQREAAHTLADFILKGDQ